MTIRELGSLGELVGAIATVATLLYLAVETIVEPHGVLNDGSRKAMAFV